MEKKFENSVLFEVRSYKGYVFTPLTLYEIFYNEKSEKRTEAIKFVLQRNAMMLFIKQAKKFNNNSTLILPFEAAEYIRPELKDDLVKLNDYFARVIYDLKNFTDKNITYSAYVYATIIVSIIRALQRYFPDEILYEFVYLCRSKSILKI